MKSLETQIGHGRELEVKKSKENEENEKTVEEVETDRSKAEVEVEQPSVFKPTLPYPQRFRKKIIDDQFAKFLEIFKKIHTNLPFADALEQMPNYAKFIKDVLSKKRNLQEFETVKLTEECSIILQKKLPQKLKDPGSFTIPCIISGNHINKALCDLGVNINLMPFSIYRDLKLGEVKPTTITLKLADRSLTYPRGIVEDVLVKVDKFMFPADFVILDMEEDQDAPLIFERPFLATGKALIDVHKGELTLRVDGEAVIFNIYKAIKGNDEVSTCKSIDNYSCVAEIGISHTVKDPLERCLSSTVSIIDNDDWELREQLLALEELPKVKEPAKEKLEEEKCSDIIHSSPVLKEFPSHLCYAFLGEKSTYPGISPTICMHRILMEESYAPYVDHQRRLNPAMKEVVKNEVLKLLNAGIIYAISDISGVSPVQVVPKKGGMTVVKNENDELISTRTVTGWRMVIQEDACWAMQCTCYFSEMYVAIFVDMVEDIMEVFMDDFSRCQEKNLVLNWEKCHFMVQEGIVLGHQVSSKGLEVDRAKVVVIEKLPPPKNVKGIRSSLGHAGFYRRFIKDFSKISKPLCNLLEKESTFIFDDDCLQAFEKIKKALVTAPIMIVPDWKEPFELMCDASGYAVGVVLGQRRDKFFRSIYYASRTMDAAQQNYTTTEKEMLAVVFAFDKFRPYLVGTKLFEVNSKLPWFADIANFLSCGTLPPDLSYHQKKKFFHDAKFYPWDDPYVFKRCADQVIRRCVDGDDANKILEQCHSSPYGGHFGATRTAAKVLQSGFYWPSLFKDSYTLVK
ncbi:uncharacterized protein [Primulina eburnea]|uniref:uncharacterized protein n=1 Tax=Primulina eburnea TaxID=1245227 RepID=UPI003C6C45A4